MWRTPTVALAVCTVLLSLSSELVCAAPDEGSAPAPYAEIDGSRQGWVVNGQSRDAVRLFWQVLYRATPQSGFWNGDVGRCDPGETLSTIRSAALARVNWFRAMAGVPADMQEDPAATRKTQAAALVVAANGRISHEIDAGWRCYSDDARQGAEVSLLGTGANGAEAVTNFMRDAGEQNAGVHHRRWLLYPQSKFMGLGDVPNDDQAKSTSGFTAYDGLYGSNRPLVRHQFVAWPPPGWVPYPVVFPRWSFSLDKADFADATVQVSVGGTPIPIVDVQHDEEAGEPSLVWQLQGLDDGMSLKRPANDTVYHVQLDQVKVAGSPKGFAYDVRVFDPDAPPAPREVTINGPAQIGMQGATYAINPVPGETSAQWRAIALQAWPLDEGAEHGYGAFSYAGGNEYAVLQQQTVASARQAFRLAHTRVGDEVLSLAQPLLTGPTTALVFSSRRGVAGTDEIARVDVRVEGHDNWETVYTQRSDGRTESGETAFSERRVDLSAYAGRMLQLRFRYSFAGGSYYTPDDARVGWYLDDIRLEGAFRIVQTGAAQPSQDNQFEFKPPHRGDWRLQARPVVYGAVGTWGPLWAVNVE